MLKLGLGSKKQIKCATIMNMQSSPSSTISSPFYDPHIFTSIDDEIEVSSL
jgi:hypothetical protein